MTPNPQLGSCKANRRVCIPTRVANVVCMKWGTRYGAVYVNRLRNMVRRQLTLEHRFVCFTDDSAGIQSDVEIRPLPVVRKPSGPEQYWNVLGLFAKPLADLEGPVLKLDLDLVIVDRIDCFFELPGAFVIAREFRRDAGPMDGNGSVFRFTAGAHAEILAAFEQDAASIAAQYEYDQDFISARIRPLSFWPDPWCVSFRRHCMRRFPWFYFRGPRVPNGARIVAFHGFPNPPDAERGYFRFRGLKFSRPVAWVREHWR